MSDPPRPSWLRTALRRLPLGGGVILGLGIVLVGTGMEVSSRPPFCGSCHIMRPYYESWQQSTHRNVACVECHIPPGVTAELRKKYEALSMVARYFTGTYGTNPWAEIDDAACLRCHERRLLSGKELFGGVLFDHAAHLAGMRRGKTLRCTSCHGQIVQGSHIAVTGSTCILCHFKDQAPNTGTARCTVCHEVPRTVIRRANLTFDHGDVARFGMDCTTCHARPEGSDGVVPRERCLTCHNEAERLEHFDETESLHRIHVTDHKVDCLNCHLEIQHVGPARLESAAPSCGSCHPQGHSPQASLYAGVGGRHVESRPNPMFLAGVRCEGCHLAIPGEHAAVHKADAVSCMTCHGPSYRRIFNLWKEGVGTRTAALQRQARETTAALGSPGPAALQDAWFNLDLVARGGGLHNVDYAYALLRRSHEDLNRARQERGLARLPAPWKEVPFESPCLSCHQGIEAQRGAVFDRSFAHEPHLLRARLECQSCHRPHDEKPKGEILRFGPSGCDDCHHAAVQASTAPAGCLTCHAAVLTRTFTVARGEFSHELHVDAAGQVCADCHSLAPGRPVTLNEVTCQGCHE